MVSDFLEYNNAVQYYRTTLYNLAVLVHLIQPDEEFHYNSTGVGELCVYIIEVRGRHRLDKGCSLDRLNRAQYTRLRDDG